MTSHRPRSGREACPSLTSHWPFFNVPCNNTIHPPVGAYRTVCQIYLATPLLKPERCIVSKNDGGICNPKLKVLFHIPVLLFRFDARFGRKTCALLCKGHREKGKCEGKKIFNRLLRGLWLWKKIQNHTFWFCSDPSFSFQGIFCNFNQFENFAKFCTTRRKLKNENFENPY